MRSADGRALFLELLSRPLFAGRRALRSSRHGSVRRLAARFRLGRCQLVSALFASMCRARGIPARILGGFYLYRTFSTNHYWAEAWIDGQG